MRICILFLKSLFFAVPVFRSFFFVVLFLGGLFFLGQGLLIPAKAWLSVHLLNHAWGQTLAGDPVARPWPWMDSVPVARLIIPDLQKDYVVLRGVSGTVLAFAPGWHEKTALPGDGWGSV